MEEFEFNNTTKQPPTAAEKAAHALRLKAALAPSQELRDSYLRQIAELGEEPEAEEPEAPRSWRQHPLNRHFKKGLLVVGIVGGLFMLAVSPDEGKRMEEYCSKEAALAQAVAEARDAGFSFADLYQRWETSVKRENLNPQEVDRAMAIAMAVWYAEGTTPERANTWAYNRCIVGK